LLLSSKIGFGTEKTRDRVAVAGSLAFAEKKDICRWNASEYSQLFGRIAVYGSKEE